MLAQLGRMFRCQSSYAWALAIGLFATGLAFAQEEAAPAAEAPAAAPEAPPVVNLFYQGLTNRAELKLRDGGKNYTKAVGDMHFALPSGEFWAAGLEPSFRTFCLELLVPIYAGDMYPFAIEPLNQPKAFGLPETPEGQKLADRKAAFVRELYGRYYQETLDNPEVAAAAFQSALWELTQEQEVPDGPMPFNLYTGTFQATYPDPDTAPAHVQLAQKYVQSLSGDDAVFAQAPALSGLQLVRLTALPTAAGAVAQSQLGLQGIPVAAGGGVGGGGGGGAPLGGLGGIPTGGGGLGAPLTRSGFGGAPMGGVGGSPFLPLGGFGGGGNGTSPISTPIANGVTPGGVGGPGAITPVVPSTQTIPSGPGGGPGGGGGGPGGGGSGGGGGGTVPVLPPVPAPPALALAGVGMVVLVVARRFRRIAP